MTWLNPWAWAGAIGVALPVLIHMLSRGHARVHKFPTLRFLDASRLLPTRRTRVHDAALLAVRAGIVAAAAAALAQPLVLTASRKRALDRGLARAIIVDTSASMRRGSAADSARAAARTLAAQAQLSVTVESSDPARALVGAAAWVARQGRRGEIVIVSDFQRGQLDTADFAVVPAGVGLTMRRVGVADSAGPVESRVLFGNASQLARTTVSATGSNIEWTSSPAPVRGYEPVVTLAADSDRAALAAARLAAATRAVPLPLDSARAIAIVFPRYPGSAALASSLTAVRQTWMSDVLARLTTDAIRIGAFGEANVAGRPRLVLFAMSEPGSLASARLIATATQSLSAAPAVRELEPETMTDAELAAWARPAAAAPSSQFHPAGDNGPSDARWVWGAVLVLLLVEMRMRSARAVARVASEARARAA